MKTISISFDYNFCNEFFETNYRGEILRGDKADNICCAIPVELSLAEGKVMFLLYCKIPKNKIPPETKAKDYIFALTTKYFPEKFSAKSYFYIYQKETLDFFEEEAFFADEISAENCSCEVNIKDKLYELLETFVEKDKTAKEIFNQIVNNLTNILDEAGCLNFYQNEINQDLFNLSRYIECGNYRYLTTWYDEKMPRLKRAFSELCRRKQVNDNYQRYMHDARVILMNISAPDIWHSEPPVMSNYANTL